MNYNILLVEDHPIMLKNYINSLILVENQINENVTFKIEKASNCKNAYDLLKNYLEKGERFKLAIIDISIPSYIEKGFLSGEDIASFISENIPETKIIISTSLEDNFRLSSMICSFKPDGVLIKSETEGEDIVRSIKDVLANKKSYSSRISRIIDNLTDISIDSLDELDRKILYELTMASKLIEIIDNLNISRANIENRKKRMKDIFDVKTDRELLIEAKKRGFI